MRFSPRAGDATIFKKIASPSQAKNRSCSRGFRAVKYISMVSAQLPSNKTKSRPLTVVHSYVSSACFFISCLLRCVHLGADMFIQRL